MIILKKLLLHNFGCFAFKEIKLKPGLNLIYGPNATGKSTIAKAIEFGTWGGKRIKLTPSNLIKQDETYGRVLLYFSQSGVEKVQGLILRSGGTSDCFVDGKKSKITDQREIFSSIIKNRGFYQEIINVPQIERFNIINNWKSIIDDFLGFSDEYIICNRVIENSEKLLQKIKKNHSEYKYSLTLTEEYKSKIERSEVVGSRIQEELDLISGSLSDLREENEILIKENEKLRVLQKDFDKLVISGRDFIIDFEKIISRLKLIPKKDEDSNNYFIRLESICKNLQEDKVSIIDSFQLREISDLVQTTEYITNELIQQKETYLKNLLEKKEEINKKLKEIESKKTITELAITGLSKSESYCLTCNQKLPENLKNNRLKNLELKFIKIQKKVEEFNNEIQTYMDAHQSSKNDLRNLNEMSKEYNILNGLMKGIKAFQKTIDSDIIRRELAKFENLEEKIKKSVEQLIDNKKKIKTYETKQFELLKEKSHLFSKRKFLFEKEDVIDKKMKDCEFKITLLKDFNDITDKIRNNFISSNYEFIKEKSNKFLYLLESEICVQTLSHEEISIIKKGLGIPLIQLSASEEELLNFVLRFSLYFFQENPQVIIIDELGVFQDKKNNKKIVEFINEFSLKIPQLIIFIRPEVLNFFGEDIMKDVNLIKLT